VHSFLQDIRQIFGTIAKLYFWDSY